MIPHNKPTLGKEEEEATLSVIRSGWLAQGYQVNAFEDEFCHFINLPQGHAVAVSSGTAALFLALWVLNAKNKIVAFPVYVCSAVRNAVAMAGAKESLVDVAEGSPNIDLEIVNKIGPDVAILPHMFGIPIDISIVKGSIIVEDCCQSLGATVDGQATGLMGDLGIFSFYATKLMTSGGQGGIIVSKKKDLVDAIRDYREFDCRDDDQRRFNFQMTDLQAAIGREQLRKLPDLLNRREEIFKMYKGAGLDLLDVEEDRDRLIPIRYRAVFKADYPKEIIEKLSKNHIKAIVPIEDWELLGDSSQFPNALQMTKQTVSIPCYPSLTNMGVDKVIRALGLS